VVQSNVPNGASVQQTPSVAPSVEPSAELSVEPSVKTSAIQADTPPSNVDALIDKVTKFMAEVKRLMDLDKIGKEDITDYGEKIVREKIYNKGDIDDTLVKLQAISNTPNTELKEKSKKLLALVEEKYKEKVDTVIEEVVAKLKEYHNTLLVNASPKFKTEYKSYIESVKGDIFKLAEMDKKGESSGLTPTQKEKVKRIIDDKIDEEVIIILGRITRDDNDLKRDVVIFIISNIMQLIKEDLNEKHKKTPISDLPKLIEIIKASPAITQMGGVNEKNKNKSKKNKQSNKRKTKRRKSANSKKIKFTKVKTL
jgi:hypothetical protein